MKPVKKVFRSKSDKPKNVVLKLIAPVKVELCKPEDFKGGTCQESQPKK